MRSTVDDKKVKIPKRTRKIQYGDHIVRSEYNEGVRRDNNRASNRLSREMQLFEKAQKVVLKDLGKETQMLRARMSTTYMSSPKLEALETPTLRMTNPFAVYGTAAVPFVKMDSSRSHRLKPITLPSASVERDCKSVSPRQSITSLKKRNSKSISGNSFVFKYENNILSSRGQADSPLKSGNTVRGTRLLSGSESKVKYVRNNSETKTAFQTEVDSSIFEILNDNNSKVECTSSLSDAGTISRMQSSRNSHISFIDILREAEERKAKQKQLEEKLAIKEEQPQRPRTPKPMTNYDDQNNKNDVTDNVFKTNDRPTRVGATPSATFVNVPY